VTRHADAQQIIDRLGLEPLPVEGGWYRATWQSPERVTQDQPYGTAIILLLTDDADGFSALHRLSHDEMWHFYAGDPVRLVMLHANGDSEDVVLGADVLNGQHVQTVVPRLTWQGAHVVAGGSWALLGATLAPGYVGAIYEGGDLDGLVGRWPDRADDIRRLVRPDAPTAMPEGFTQ
jgi:uncharacterized protein